MKPCLRFKFGCWWVMRGFFFIGVGVTPKFAWIDYEHAVRMNVHPITGALIE